MKQEIEVSSLERIDNLRSKLKRVRRKSWLMAAIFAILGVVFVVASLCTSIKALGYVGIAPFALAVVVIIAYMFYEARTEERIKEIVFDEITSGRR